MISANVESFKNLEENLRHHNMNLAEMPHIIQFNKRDLPKVADVEELNTAVNKYNAPFYEAVATTGIGVQDTLKAITKLVLLHLTKKYDPEASANKSQVAVPNTPSVAIPTPETPIPPAAHAAQQTPSIQPGMNNPAMNAAPQALDLSPSFSIDSPAEQGLADINPAASSPSMSVSVDTGADVDDMMAEIADAPVVSPGDQTQIIDTPDFDAPSFELDSAPAAPAATESQASFSDPGSAQAQAANPEPAAPPLQENTYSKQASEDEVLLKDVATDEDLFNAANLDVATMASGEVREIVIPIQLDSGAGLKPFKLSVRLKLDPADE